MDEGMKAVNTLYSKYVMHQGREDFAADFFQEIGENMQQKVKVNYENFQWYFISVITLDCVDQFKYTRCHFETN